MRIAALLTVLLGTAAVGAATPAVASARPNHRIVLWKSIGGVSIGESHTAVRRYMGKPQHTIHYPTGGYHWDYDHGTFAIEFVHGRVNYLGVTNPAFHGPRGVRPGAPWSKAKQVYDGAPCGSLTFQCTFSFGRRTVAIQHAKLEMFLSYKRVHGARGIDSISLLRGG